MRIIPFYDEHNLMGFFWRTISTEGMFVYMFLKKTVK